MKLTQILLASAMTIATATTFAATEVQEPVTSEAQTTVAATSADTATSEVAADATTTTTETPAQ